MNKTLALYVLICLSLPSSAQDTAIEIKVVKPQDKNSIIAEPMTAGRVFQVAEQMPEYPGGEDAMMKFLRSNLVYPSIPEWDSTTHKSRLVIQFIVNEDGSLSDIEIVKSVYASFDAETLRVVKLFPRFKPGKQNGLAVRVKYLLPIIFDVGMR